MQAIIHVGDKKNGSKSIQGFVKANQRLLQASGILVSRATRCGPYHSLLASYALDDSRLAANPRREWGITDKAQLADHRFDVERRIADEVAAAGPGINTFLFSHEGLLALGAEETDRLMTMLRKFFSGFRIVAYLRRQDRHLVSQWGQHLKAGKVPRRRFLENFRHKQSYLEMLDNWEHAVGRENLSVRVFESKSFLHGCLYRDFCAAAGIAWNAKFLRPRPANIGIDRVAQTFLLALNARIHAGAGPAEQRGHVVPFLEGCCTGEGIKPPRAWAKQVTAFFARENEEIRRRYFPQRPALFDNDFGSYPEGGSPDCTAPEAIDLAVTMWQHFQQGPTEKEIQEAYRLVLGRQASPEEVANHARAGASIRNLYVSLLNSGEYCTSRKSSAVENDKAAA
jgi:hypothetical protein